MPLTYLETIRAQDVDVPATKFNFFGSNSNIILGPVTNQSFTLSEERRSKHRGRKKVRQTMTCKIFGQHFLPTSFVCLPTPKIFSRPERGPRWKSPAPGC